MWMIIITILMLPIMACSSNSNKAKEQQLPNPASVKCVNDGHRLEIRKDEKGNEYGICISADGKECDEWAYFRDECRL